VRLVGTFLLLILIKGLCFSQNEHIIEKYYEALTLLNVKHEYSKADSLLNVISPDLKSFDKPDYYVFSLLFRGLSHIKSKNYFRALDFLFKALDTSKQVNNGKDYYLLASIYYSLADVFYNLGYFELSEYYISYCSEFLESGETFVFEAGSCEANQGYLSVLVGDYYNAIRYIDRALDLNDRSDFLPHHYEWTSIKALCNAHLEHFDIANKEINNTKSISKLRFPKDTSLYTFLLSDEAEIKLLAKDTLGVKSILDSVNMLTTNQHMQLNNYLSFINYYQLTGQIDSTNKFVDMAIEHATNNVSFNNYKLAETYLVSSQTKFDNNNYTDALAHILTAQEILTKKKDIIPNEDSYRSFNARLFLQVLLHKSRIQYKLNDREALITTSKDILELLDLFFDQRLALEESKFFFLKKLKYQFEQLIENCIDLKENELAFSISQKLHGNLLVLDIMKNNAAKNYNLPNNYVDQENHLKIAINEHEIKLLQLEYGSIEFDSISEDLIQNKSNLKKLTKSIESSNPGYYTLKYGNPKIKSISDIQNELLNRNSALIEYFIGKNKLYIFIISHKKLSIIQKDIGADFYQHVKIHNDHLRILLDSPVGYEEYVESTEYLYKILLADAFNILGPKVKHMYLIPDGVISYIPFGSLFEQCPKNATGNRYNYLPFLARDFNFYYHYSSALFESKQDDLTQKFTGFAPDFKNHNSTFNLSELAYNKEEVELISYISKGDAQLDSAANIFTVKESLAEKGILHLATHAESNDSIPLLSRIFLQDGPLHAYEIYNSQNKLDLAVLSACETGDGTLKTGEGIMSLARSFLSSGCETIITSMWKVNDRNSVKLMQLFYHHLYKGESIGNSLAEAKRDYIENAITDLQAHPYNWASFTSIGNPNQSISRIPWNYILLSVCLLGLSILLWKRDKIIVYN